MYPIFQFFGAPILGRLSDRFGRKPVLILSIAGTMLGFIVLATARSLWILFFSRALDGITGGNISVAQAYISDVTEPEERGKALGMIGAAFGLGFILGPVTGGLLSGISYTAPAWLGAALAAVNLVLVASLLPESLTAEDKARLARGRAKASISSALRRGAAAQARRPAAHGPHSHRRRASASSRAASRCGRSPHWRSRRARTRSCSPTWACSQCSCRRSSSASSPSAGAMTGCC